MKSVRIRMDFGPFCNMLSVRTRYVPCITGTKVWNVARAIASRVRVQPQIPISLLRIILAARPNLTMWPRSESFARSAYIPESRKILFSL